VAKPPNESEQGAGTGSGAPKLLAELECSGLKPHFLEKMAANGVVMPPNFFSEGSAGYVAYANASYGSFE
jgi:hypothetical protein